MTRQWTPDELALIDSTPATWPRKAKIDVETVKAIRRKVDSLSIPWTLAELAAEFGLNEDQISLIARRLRWRERAHEPGTYWRD